MYDLDLTYMFRQVGYVWSRYFIPGTYMFRRVGSVWSAWFATLYSHENVHVYVCSRVIIRVGSCISEPLYARSDTHTLTTSQPTVVMAASSSSPPPINHTATQLHKHAVAYKPRTAYHCRRRQLCGTGAANDVGCRPEVGSSADLAVYIYDLDITHTFARVGSCMM